MPNNTAVSELKQIPFAQIIGGPLKAAVEAQALAAQSTIEFIHKVGFKGEVDKDDLVFSEPGADADAGEIRNVAFTYKKTNADGEDVDFKLEVPLLTITPVPYIRIDEVTIDFSAKLSDSITRNVKTGFKVDSELKAGYGAFFSPVKVDFRVSASYNRNTDSSESRNREYKMNVNVRAVQDQLPRGLERVLNILEDAVQNKEIGPGGGD